MEKREWKRSGIYFYQFKIHNGLQKFWKATNHAQYPLFDKLHFDKKNTNHKCCRLKKTKYSAWSYYKIKLGLFLVCLFVCTFFFVYQGSFCVCPQPMADDVTIKRRFLLAGRIHKMALCVQHHPIRFWIWSGVIIQAWVCEHCSW